MTVNVISLEHPRGYPAEYVSDFVAGDGTRFTVRPIRGDDEPLMVDFHRQLSTDTVYRRYFGILKFDARVAHERLLLRCSIDYSKEMALVAEYVDTENGRHIAGVGRFIRNPAGNSAEVAFVVADAYQHHGLGTYLLRQLTEIARREGVVELEAEVLADNYNMKNLFHRAGFSFSQPDGGDGDSTTETSLNENGQSESRRIADIAGVGKPAKTAMSGGMAKNNSGVSEIMPARTCANSLGLVH